VFVQALTEKDIKDALYALECDVDLFVRGVDDAATCAAGLTASLSLCVCDVRLYRLCSARQT